MILCLGGSIGLAQEMIRIDGMSVRDVDGNGNFNGSSGGGGGDGGIGETP